MLSKVIFTFLAVVVLTFGGTATGVAGTGGNGSGGGDQSAPGQGGGDNGGGGLCSSDFESADLSKDEIDYLLFIREEEKVARDSYIGLGDLWGMIIFENIAASEQQHMDAVKALVSCYGLVDPVIDVVGVFTDADLQVLYDVLAAAGRQSAMDGLKVGALIEETDIVDIQQAIEVTDHADIASTYESIVCGSRNHLRAFIRQIENNGGSYEPEVLDPGTFWDIAHSPMETDCGDL